MSPINILWIIFSLSTSIETSTPAPSHVESISQLQSSTAKPWDSCTSSKDCLKFGSNMTCVDEYCICNFGYRPISPSEKSLKCIPIVCTGNTNCSTNFINSHCDVSGSCTCNDNFEVNRTTASCEQEACTQNIDCSGAFSVCFKGWCVCKFGYVISGDDFNCTYAGPAPEGGPSNLGVILGVLGGVLLLTLVGVILGVLFRNQIAKAINEKRRRTNRKR